MIGRLLLGIGTEGSRGKELPKCSSEAKVRWGGPLALKCHDISFTDSCKYLFSFSVYEVDGLLRKVV